MLRNERKRIDSEFHSYELVLIKYSLVAIKLFIESLKESNPNPNNATFAAPALKIVGFCLFTYLINCLKLDFTAILYKI